MKQQVTDLSTCNFSSREYMPELNVVMIFYVFLMSEFQRRKKCSYLWTFLHNYKGDPYSRLKEMQSNYIGKCLLIMLD